MTATTDNHELRDKHVEALRLFRAKHVFDSDIASALDAAIALMRGQSCVWTIDADPYAEMWNGACGIAWTFTEGGPADNECNHCPKCGGRIEISDQPKDSADEQ